MVSGGVAYHTYRTVFLQLSEAFPTLNTSVYVKSYPRRVGAVTTTVVVYVIPVVLHFSEAFRTLNSNTPKAKT